jgi:Tfp pilus assembly protein PilN
MIRINLLETAEKRRRRKRQIPSGTPIIALYVVLLVMEGVLLFYWSTVKEETLQAQKKIQMEAQTQLDGFNKLKGERDELAEKMAEEEQQAKIFETLNASTVGPANMLLYLSYMLTTPPLSNHKERVVQEQIGWNKSTSKESPQWDPDRAWVTSFKEGTNKEVILEGLAVSHHDTDEFFKRLKSTIYFQNVHFISAKVGKQRNQEATNSLIEFKIQAHINYNLTVGKEAAEGADGKGDEKGKANPKGGKKPQKKG